MRRLWPSKTAILHLGSAADLAAKTKHHKIGATQGIRIAVAAGLYRAEAADGRGALVVQGMVPFEDPPWAGLKEPP
jgi:hypothetical protein